MPSTLAALRRIFLAQDCVLCAAQSGDALVCGTCNAALPALSESCPQCALPSPAGQLCGQCLREPPAFDLTLAVWRYGFPLDRLIQALKYGSRLALADWFGRALAARVADARVDLIMPMPLHPARLRERGFNQALEIARRCAPVHGGRLVADGLLRLRDTPAQTSLPHDARALNMRDAFACAMPLAGLRLAVVDDVMTTGVTLNEAAKALRSAGAAHVENWVIARAFGGPEGA